MYALLRVMRSAWYRIAETHETGMAYNGLDFQTAAGGCRVGSIEYQHRIEGTQNLRTARPWTTGLDSLLFLEGFAAGVEHCNRIAGISKHTVASPAVSYSNEV
jgi:hypothetical protein